MKTSDFIKKLDIHQTDSGKGKGVLCNLRIYMYPDGHGNIYSVDNAGRNKNIGTPTADHLGAVDTFIDILNAIKKKANRLKS